MTRQVRIIIDFEIGKGGPAFSGQIRVIDPKTKAEYSHPLNDSFCSKVATALAPKAVDEVRRTAIKDGPARTVLDLMFSSEI